MTTSHHYLTIVQRVAKHASPQHRAHQAWQGLPYCPITLLVSCSPPQSPQIPSRCRRVQSFHLSASAGGRCAQGLSEEDQEESVCVTILYFSMFGHFSSTYT
jgi:hypothetical protein